MIKTLNNGTVSISKDAFRCILKYGEKIGNEYRYQNYRFNVLENKIIRVFQSYKSGEIKNFQFKQY